MIVHDMCSAAAPGSTIRGSCVPPSAAGSGRAAVAFRLVSASPEHFSSWFFVSSPLKSSCHARRTGPALEAHFQFLLWLVPTVDKFPRSQKFLLGDRIQNIAIDVLQALDRQLRSNLLHNWRGASSAVAFRASGREPAEGDEGLPTTDFLSLSGAGRSVSSMGVGHRSVWNSSGGAPQQDADSLPSTPEYDVASSPQSCRRENRRMFPIGNIPLPLSRIRR